MSTTRIDYLSGYAGVSNTPGRSVLTTSFTFVNGGSVQGFGAAWSAIKTSGKWCFEVVWSGGSNSVKGGFTQNGSGGVNTGYSLSAGTYVTYCVDIEKQTVTYYLNGVYNNTDTGITWIGTQKNVVPAVSQNCYNSGSGYASVTATINWSRDKMSYPVPQGYLTWNEEIPVEPNSFLMEKQMQLITLPHVFDMLPLGK